jgi:beta-lactamase regulating signal transducer with metallopeptidase domain
MIHTIGTFFAICLVLWLALSIVFVALYPFMRSWFMSLHPRYGSLLLLAFWTAPFIASLSSTLILFMPSIDSVLIDPHCHSDCSSHVPLISSTGLAWFGFTTGSIVFLLLIYRLLHTMYQSLQLRRQFNFLGRKHGDYYTINSRSPLVFTLGWWKPRIYISEGLSRACANKDLSIVLLHEQAHQERRDNLRLLMARLCSAILIGRLARNVMNDLRLMTEEACDFRAAERFGHVAVAETLLKIKRLLMNQPSALPQHALAFAERDVESRVIALLKGSALISPRPWQLGLLSVLLIFGLVLMVGPLHHGSEWIIALLTDSAGHVH